MKNKIDIRNNFPGGGGVTDSPKTNSTKGPGGGGG